MANATTTARKSGKQVSGDASARGSAGRVDVTARVHVDRLGQPLYLYVGAVDLCVEKIRAVPTGSASLARGTAREVTGLPGEVRGFVAGLTQRGERVTKRIARKRPAQEAVAEVKAAASSAADAVAHAGRAAAATEKTAEVAAAELG